MSSMLFRVEKQVKKKKSTCEKLKRMWREEQFISNFFFSPAAAEEQNFL